MLPSNNLHSFCDYERAFANTLETFYENILAHLAQLQAQLRNQGLGNLVPELLNLNPEGPAPAAAAAAGNAGGNVNPNDPIPPNITITGNGNLNQLGNILQIPNLLHGLNNDPLPPPPPMPPVDLAKLTEDELKLMENVERKGLEGMGSIITKFNSHPLKCTIAYF